MTIGFLTNSRLIHAFCYAHENMEAQEILNCTAKEVEFSRSTATNFDKVKYIVQLIESTPANTDQLAHAKCRLKEMTESAYMNMHPETQTIMGLKF